MRFIKSRLTRLMSRVKRIKLFDEIIFGVVQLVSVNCLSLCIQIDKCLPAPFPIFGKYVFKAFPAYSTEIILLFLSTQQSLAQKLVFLLVKELFASYAALGSLLCSQQLATHLCHEPVSQLQQVLIDLYFVVNIIKGCFINNI